MSSAYIIHRPGKLWDYIVAVDVRDYVGPRASYGERHAENPEAAANASLIAAAPDLLAALEETWAYVDPHSPIGARVRDAIKKAKGQ